MKNKPELLFQGAINKAVTSYTNKSKCSINSLLNITTENFCIANYKKSINDDRPKLSKSNDSCLPLIERACKL